MAQEEPSLRGVTRSSLECRLEQDKGNKAVLWPVLLPCVVCPVRSPERSTGHAQCVLVCHIIVFISPALGTPWLGVRGPAGSSPIPSRTAGWGRDPVMPWMSSCAHGVSANPAHVASTSSRLSPAGAVHVRVRRDPREWPCRCSPVSPVLSRPAGHLPSSPAPGEDAACSSLCSPHVQDEMLVRPQHSPQGSCLQTRLTLSVRVLSWAGPLGPHLPGPSLGRA